MITRNNTKTPEKNSKRSRTSRFGTYVAILSCVALLGAGFFLAAQQHFSSMDYGMKNSRLRKQLDQLESEKRRLIVSREISLSPSEIKKALKKAGMTEPSQVVAQLASVAAPAKAKPLPSTVEVEKALITKTVSVSPARVSAVFKKEDRVAKNLKKNLFAE